MDESLNLLILILNQKLFLNLFSHCLSKQRDLCVRFLLKLLVKYTLLKQKIILLLKVISEDFLHQVFFHLQAQS